MYIPTAVLTQGFAGTIIFSQTLGADTATLDTGPNGIPGGFNLLEIWILCRTTEVAVGSGILVTVNNDGGANYDFALTRTVNGTVTGTTTLAAVAWTLPSFGASAQAGAVTLNRMTIPSYAQTTFHKVAEVTTEQLEDTAADCRVQVTGLRYRSTAAVTQMTVATGSSSLLAGSQLLIYAR